MKGDHFTTITYGEQSEIRMNFTTYVSVKISVLKLIRDFLYNTTTTILVIYYYIIYIHES